MLLDADCQYFVFHKNNYIKNEEVTQLPKRFTLFKFRSGHLIIRNTSPGYLLCE
jgi:hypothetical protein